MRSSMSGRERTLSGGPRQRRRGCDYISTELPSCILDRSNPMELRDRLASALGRPVVIKLLPPELAHGVSADRFRQEAQSALARLAGVKEVTPEP